MERLLGLLQNDILIVSLSTWIIAQILKSIINLLVAREFSFERLFGDGGMPSSHSATVMALTVICGWTQGFDSAIFAVSFMFAAVVMHDACGVRREAGKHASSIKELADALNRIVREKDVEVKTENLKLLVGHTPLQVFFGAMLGLTVAVLYIVIFLIS